MHHHSGPFKIPAINDYVPEKVKPWIFIFFLLIIQFSGGGIYLATLNETIGERSLMLEDVLMAGFSSMAGMSLVFVFMLRLKMRFPTKIALMVCGTMLIACNLVALTTNNLLVLIAVSFIAGMFRMWATFECNSTIQLWITPTRDMPVFFSYVYLVVNGVILLGGATDMYVSLLTNYSYINWVVIGFLILMMLLVMLLFNSRRIMPKFPLFGIDWLGGFMWGLILLNINFITVYGEHYDWWNSREIQLASMSLIVLLGLNLYRASFIRHPFIALNTFKFKPLYHSLLLYMVIDIFVAPSHLIEHIYFEEILNYDIPQMMHINLISWIGILVGAIFTWRFFAVKKNSFKTTFLIGFSGVLLYTVMMYFLIDYNTPKEYFAFPIFLRNFGYVVMAIVLLSDLVKIPFSNFFQSISVQSFMSAACGSAIGVAVIHRMLSIISTKNFQLLSSSIDHTNTKAMEVTASELSHFLELQTLLISFKEIYGYLVIAGILFWIFLVLYRYPYFPKNLLYPRASSINKMLKKELE